VSPDKKNNLSNQEVLVQLDFSENYTFIAQNAAHFILIMIRVRFFLLLFIINLKHFSTISMSDCTTHDVTGVYIMQQKLIPEIQGLSQSKKDYTIC